MKNLSALIIDDEPLAHDVIINYCSNVPFINVVWQCYSATEALSYLQQKPVDVLFLDINMPMLSGLDLLKVLKSKPQVIITSAYQEYALESFELSVSDYLLKPLAFERFLQACNKVQQQFQLLQQAKQANQATIPKRLFVTIDRQQVQLDLAQVSCFEAYGNYVKVWRDGKSQLTPRTLGSFESQLPEAMFIRVHKSAIVNLGHIDSLDGQSIWLKDGKQVGIGKSYRANVQKVLANKN